MLLRMALSGDQNVPIHATPSLEVIGFAFALSVVTGILFGVAPAWITASANPADALRSGTRTTATGASLLQRGVGGFGASFVKANAEFFDSVGTRVTMGRGIGVQDTSTAPTVAVVNEAFAKHYLKGLN